MPEHRATFESALWNHAGKVAEYALVYITSVVIARALGVERNGTFAVVLMRI